MLWMVRAFPGQTDRIATFLENGIIAVHWGIGNLTGCKTKADIAKVVALANLQPRDASLKVGLLDRFVNQMQIGEYCIVPYEDVFYTALIKSGYYFDPKSVGLSINGRLNGFLMVNPLDVKNSLNRSKRQ